MRLYVVEYLWGVAHVLRVKYVLKHPFWSQEHGAFLASSSFFFRINRDLV